MDATRQDELADPTVWMQGLRDVAEARMMPIAPGAMDDSAGGLMSAHRPRRVFDASGSDSSAGRLLPADRTDERLPGNGLLRISTSTRRGRDAQKKNLFCGKLYRKTGHMTYLSSLAAQKRKEEAASRREESGQALRTSWNTERLRVGDTVGAGGRRS